MRMVPLRKGSDLVIQWCVMAVDLQQLKQRACAAIDRHASELKDTADWIHAHPEIGHQEVQAAARLSDLLRNSGDGAGDDQADSGSSALEREQELTLVNNTRDLLVQSQHALGRISAGTYGTCESCGRAIGKARLQAFPRATLCVECKQREERR